MNKTFILWVLLLLACTSISQAQTAGTPTSYGSSTSVGTAPTIPSITDSTIIKIPIDGSRWYQLDNVSNGLQALFDGDTVTSVSTGYGKLLTNFDAYYPVADDEAMDIYKIKFYDGSGTITATPMTLYAIDNKGVKTLLGTFTGSQYNEWVGPNGNTQYSLGTPIRNVRYLVLNSSSAYPTEMQIYGTYRSGAGASAATPKPVKLSQMFGVNAFEWNFLDPNNPGTINESEMTAGRSFTQIRHYLDWGRIEPTKGGYTFSPSHNGGWDYDALYTRLNKEGIEVLADIKTLPQWLLNTYPADQQDAENVPVPYGSDFSDPNSYILQAKVAFQFAARYGSNKSVNTSLQSVDGSQRWANDPANVVKTGLGLIRYIECDNERDKWWKGRKAYQTAYEYAANLSAFYDGNKNTMGPGVGVKNADPNMQVVMCGTALATPDYIKGMVDWCKLHRGYKADGTVNLCWDVINYHLYSNNAGTSQGGNSTAGAAPEGSGAAGTAQDFINVAHQYIQNMPVWVTELGYDINQGSPLKAIPIGSKTAAQTQADWSLRSALLYARAGVQRIFFYEMYDDNPTSTVQFASSGLINADNSRRPVADYLYQTNKLLGAYTYSNTISTNPYVDIYTLNGKNAYVLAMPTQNGSTKSYNLDLNQADSAMIYTPAIGQDSMSVQKVKTSSGKLSLTVTETPMFVIPYGTLAKDTTPVVKDSTPVVVTPPVVDSTPVVVTPPVVKDSTPVVVTPPVVDSTPVVVTPPVVKDSTPVVVTPPVIDSTPVVVTPPVVKDSTPVVVTPPVVDSTPVVVTPPVVKDSTPVVVTPPVVDSTPVVVTPPVVKDTTNGGGASQGYLSTDTSSTAKDSAIDTEPLAFNVYPNPAQSYINITYTDNYVGNVTFILYSASGHIAKIERVYKSAETITEQIDISTLRNGVYMLQLKSNSYEVLTRKVIKIS